MTRAAAKVQEATPDDLANVVELIRVGDDRPYAAENVERFIQRLNPDHARAWLATADDHPVGMSMLYVRTVLGGDRRYRTGYWANLYIDPAYRDQMLYPRLPMATFGTVKRGELDFVYALVRRQNLIEAHQRLGAAKVADLPLLVKPLRPALLVVKHRGWRRGVRTLARPFDALFSVYLRLRRTKVSDGVTLESVSWDSDEIADLAELLGESRMDQVRQDWTVKSLRARYSVSLDGDPYRLLIVRRGNEPTAAVVWRMTDRDHDLRLGVVMELACALGGENDARFALSEAETCARAAGGEGMMFLDGLGARTSEVVRRAGYLKTPEVFTLVVWPQKIVAERELLGDLHRWRLSFGDHDAF